MPPPLRYLIDAPPPVSAWIPEVHLNALVLVCREAGFNDDESFRAWSAESMRGMFTGPLYRIVFALTSPHQLSRSSARRWTVLRQGTTRELLGLYANGSIGRLDYPDHLYDRFLAEWLTTSFRVILSLSRAPNPEVRLTEWTPSHMISEGLFDRHQPLGERIE